MLLVLVLGCVPIATFQRAQTMGYGNWEIVLEPGFVAAAAVPSAGVGGHEEGRAVPHAGATFRYGVGEQTDLALRASPGGLEAGLKLGLSGPRDEFALSIAPTLGGGYADTELVSASVVHGSLPVLLGVPLAPEHQLAFSAGLLASHHGAPREHDTFGSVGVTASAGYAWQANPQVAVLPQVALYVPFLRVGNPDLGGTMAGEVAVHAGVGLCLSPPPFWSAR